MVPVVRGGGSIDRYGSFEGVEIGERAYVRVGIGVGRGMGRGFAAAIVDGGVLWESCR